MAPTTATQIERANSAVARLTAGQDWPEVVRALGYFDQPHLAHALQRFVGRTAGELRTSGLAGMSFLYKTGPEPAE